MRWPSCISPTTGPRSRSPRPERLVTLLVSWQHCRPGDATDGLGGPWARSSDVLVAAGACDRQQVATGRCCASQLRGSRVWVQEVGVSCCGLVLVDPAP